MLQGLAQKVWSELLNAKSAREVHGFVGSPEPTAYIERVSECAHRLRCSDSKDSDEVACAEAVLFLVGYAEAVHKAAPLELLCPRTGPRPLWALI